MRGVCVDALNNPPTPRQLHNLGATGVRMEMRDNDLFYDYYQQLSWAKLEVSLLLGPSTENPANVIQNLIYQPSLIIIGNEPDGIGESSWSMTPEQYTLLWNTYTPIVRERFPQTQLCTAGMVGNPNYLESVWSSLKIQPDLVNKHYPNDQGEIQAYSIFNAGVVVGEWCWRTASLSQMIYWERMLEVTCLHSFWFCWSDLMVDTMGLISKKGHKRVCYDRYKKALL